MPAWSTAMSGSAQEVQTLSSLLPVDALASSPDGTQQPPMQAEGRAQPTEIGTDPHPSRKPRQVHPQGFADQRERAEDGEQQRDCRYPDPTSGEVDAEIERQVV